MLHQVRSTGPTNARIMLIQEAPGYDEIKSSEPFQGSAGYLLNSILSDAGIMRSECFLTSLLRTQPLYGVDSLVAKSKKEITEGHLTLHDKYVTPNLIEGLNFLIKEIELLKPLVIVACGNLPLFALTGKWGIKSWRGSELIYESPSGHRCYIIGVYPPDFVRAVYKERGISVADFQRVRVLSQRTEIREPKNYNFIVSPSFGICISTIQELQARCNRGPTKISVDIETRAGHIACIGLAWSTLDAICIPLMVARESNPHYWMEHEEAFIHHRLYLLLTHPNIEIVGQNFIYDAQYFLRHLHYIPRLVRDTMLSHHAMYSCLPKGLDYLSSIYCEEHVYWKGESKDWDPKVGEVQLWTYNCKDCVITFEVDDSEQAAIEKLAGSGWDEIHDVVNFQQSLFWPVLETMVRGIKVNHESRAKLSQELGEALETREQWMETVVGRRINIRSPKQMQDFFYRELDQKPIYKRGTRNLTCDDAALERLGNREPLLLPVLEKISEMRSIGVFKSTFVDAPTDIDERMRCSFNIAGTVSYRFSSSQNAFGSGMNLQNIPKGDEDTTSSETPLPNVRKLFLPDKDHLFFDIDLDSADLRIVVEEANVPAMRAWLEEGKKPYVEVAKEYYKDPSITKSHPAYKFFKAFCHATHYLGTPEGMCDAVNGNLRGAGLPSMTITELETLQSWYFSLFPEIKTWHEKIIEQVHSKRYVQNPFGYRFWFFDRIDKNVLNQAIALIPQSTVACIINRGYKNLHDNHPEIEVLLQVHDSLAGQFHKSIDGVTSIREACSIIVPYKNPLIIPVDVKTSSISWGHCE